MAIENNLAKIKFDLNRLSRQVCCLLEGNIDFSQLPEYENNTAAINGVYIFRNTVAQTNSHDVTITIG